MSPIVPGTVQRGVSAHCPRSAAVSLTSRSRFAKLAGWHAPDAAEIFHALRLVLDTQPRSNFAAFGGSALVRPVQRGQSSDKKQQHPGGPELGDKLIHMPERVIRGGMQRGHQRRIVKMRMRQARVGKTLHQFVSSVEVHDLRLEHPPHRVAIDKPL